MHSQCFDCAINIGGHTSDYSADIEKTNDGIVFAVESEWKSTINKYDFNCNLIWSIVLNSNYTEVKAITSDELGNIYLAIHYTISTNAGMGPWNIDGFLMSPGLNIFKLNSNGTIIWREFIAGIGHNMTNIHYFQNKLLVTGTFYSDILFSNGLNFNYPYTNYARAFIAKFDDSGNFIDAINYGNGVEYFNCSEFDDQGNTYMTNSHFNGLYSNIIKFNSSLQLEWITELSNSNSNNTGIYIPNGLRYNHNNDKLYLWGRISQTTTILGHSFFVSNSNAVFQSLLTEFNTSTGDLTNHQRFDNNSAYTTATSSALVRGRSAYMTEKDGYLYVLTSFRGTMVFLNNTINSTTNTINGGNYSEDLLLFRVDVSNFSSEFLSKSYGVSGLYYFVTDLPGPIIFNNDDLYITATYSSKPMQLNGVIINNNSGNNDADALYFRYNLDEIYDELISFNNTCFSELTEFEISGNFDSISWDFDDPVSGTLNNSTSSTPVHQFTSVGTYDVSTIVTCGNNTETFTTQVIITDIPTLYTIPEVYTCDSQNSNVLEGSFDTSQIEFDLIGNQSNVIIKYFDENGNTLPSPLPNPFNTGTQNITARVENQINPNCFNETTISFIVINQPTANPIVNDFVCDDTSNDPQYLYTLSDYDSQILNGQSDSIYEVQYFDNDIDAQNNNNPLSNSYLVNTNSQTLFARIQNISYPDCFDVTNFELGVHNTPVAYQPPNMQACDGDDQDGVVSFDFIEQHTAILLGQSQSQNSVSFHLSQADADSNSNPLNTNFNNTESPQRIYVRVENTNLEACYDTTFFDIEVRDTPSLQMQTNWVMCEKETLTLTADVGYDTYLWSTGATTRSITVSEAGSYTVIVGNQYGNLICETSLNLSVIESNPATILNLETVDWTTNENSISISVEGIGDYEYSIDGFTYQDNPVFSNLSIDDYTVYVRDKNGCGVVTEEVYLLNYPRFFTPNGDGENERWQIINSEKEPNNRLSIYDRYGKLITTINPNDSGWDGRYNGNLMPSTDYWFVLNRQNGRVYSGHFSLIR